MRRKTTPKKQGDPEEDKLQENEPQKDQLEEDNSQKESSYGTKQGGNRLN